MTTAIGRPLEGMLVLDLGQIYNGPYCGLLLGFMGARVLKIEAPEGDVVRRRKRDVEPYPLVMLNSNNEHPRRGETRVPISPIRFHGGAPARVERVAPLLGQDTDRVLAEILELGADELAALHAARVIDPVEGGAAS